MFVVEMLYAGGVVEWRGTYIFEDVAHEEARSMILATAQRPDVMGVAVRMR